MALALELKYEVAPTQGPQDIMPLPFDVQAAPYDNRTPDGLAEQLILRLR